MRRFIRLVARFRSDESGVFAVLFGLIAIILIAMGGATVDFASLEQTRSRAQSALDASVLALQPRIFEEPIDEADILAQAQALMIERIGDPRVTAEIETITTDPVTGSLYLEAHLEMPTIFVSLVGVQQMRTRLWAEATRRRLALEVVMVLDNSGSMKEENRMAYLKDAAECATYIMFFDTIEDDSDDTCAPGDDAEQIEDVKVGLVPFTMFVNVGANNADEPWIDQGGNSSISPHNFDNDDNDANTYAGPVDRLALFDSLRNEDWRGCVEARPHISSGARNTEYLDTDDTEPAFDNGSPITSANTLYVPHFSPDLPDSLGGYISDQPAVCQYTGTCTMVKKDVKCTSTNYNSCQTRDQTTSTLAGSMVGGLASNSCSCSGTATSTDTSTSGSGNNRTYNRTRTWVCQTKYNAQGLSNVELQERLCKYNNANVPTGFSEGPNADCTEEPILPLTDVPEDVIDSIGDMEALGGTNIHEGTAWGFRVLSPTEPFTEGVEYDHPTTSKVMIIMTDGENTAYNLSDYCGSGMRNLNGSCYYSAYGFPRNRRLGTLGTSNANLVKEMNTRTSQTCENAKAAGITVYTIGLATDKVSQSTEEVVEKMLTDCASEPGNAHFPESPRELKDVFRSIADELAALRLAQ